MLFISLFLIYYFVTGIMMDWKRRSKSAAKREIARDKHGCDKKVLEIKFLNVLPHK